MLVEIDRVTGSLTARVQKRSTITFHAAGGGRDFTTAAWSTTETFTGACEKQEAAF
jgi:hypothetical protein